MINNRLEKIEKGDRVAVNFNGAQITLCHDAIVVYMPCATGDSWVFKDYYTGEVYYVSEGCTITRLNKPMEDE